MSTSYPSDLSDAEWECVQRYLPSLSLRGRPRTHPLRRILDAIFYVLRTGCPWRYLPSNFPAWQTVYYHFRQFRRKNILHALYPALHRAERERVGRNPDPSAAILDSQSVKTVEESGGIRGYDGGKLVKGRKRHLLVDTLGLPITWYVTPADLSDPQGARRLLGGLAFFVPRLKKIWADAAYRGKELAAWCLQQGDGWALEVVEREPGTRGFQVQPRRWVVERSFAWLSRNRRLAKDYERRVQTSETLIEIAATRLLLRRLAGSWCPAGGQGTMRRGDEMRRRSRGLGGLSRMVTPNGSGDSEALNVCTSMRHLRSTIGSNSIGSCRPIPSRP